VKFLALITYFFLFASFQGKCQSINSIDSIETVKKLLRKNASVESLYLGLHAKSSKQCLRFLFIVKRSSMNDIEALLNDSSACLRIYAYSYLRSLNYNSLRKVKLTLQKDSSRIYFISDCVGGNTEVRYVLKRIKQWETDGKFEMWMKDYTEHENYWINLLMAEK
jgi:hypothetical protein